MIKEHGQFWWHWMGGVCSYEDAVESITTTTTAARVSKRQVEEMAARAATDFDAFYALKPQERLGRRPCPPPHWRWWC